MSIASRTLASNEWMVWPTAVGLFDSVQFPGTFYNFHLLLLEAMSRVVRDIPNGNLYRQADALIAANAPVGFTISDMVKYLRDGEFVYSAAFPLAIYGPSPDDQTQGSWGSASVGWWDGDQLKVFNSSIHVNPAALINYGNVAFPGDAGRMAVLVGATVLHEVMHIHSFRHVEYDQSHDTPSDPYNRSLPEIIGQAFVNIYYPGMTFLTGDNSLPSIKCGVRSNSLYDRLADPRTNKAEVFEHFTRKESELKQLALIKQRKN